MSLLDDAMDLIMGRAKCPKCKSKSVTIANAHGLSAEFTNVTLKCQDCGNTWSERSLKKLSS